MNLKLIWGKLIPITSFIMGFTCDSFYQFLFILSVSWKQRIVPGALGILMSLPWFGCYPSYPSLCFKSSRWIISCISIDCISVNNILLFNFAVLVCAICLKVSYSFPVFLFAIFYSSVHISVSLSLFVLAVISEWGILHRRLKIQKERYAHPFTNLVQKLSDTWWNLWDYF